MRNIGRVFGVTTMLAVVLAAFVWVQDAVSKLDMSGFDPQEMGILEFAMWRSYLMLAYAPLKETVTNGR